MLPCFLACSSDAAPAFYATLLSVNKLWQRSAGCLANPLPRTRAGQRTACGGYNKERAVRKRGGQVQSVKEGWKTGYRRVCVWAGRRGQVHSWQPRCRTQACGGAARAPALALLLLPRGPSALWVRAYEPNRKKPPPPPLPPSSSSARWSLAVRSATWRMKRAGVSTPVGRVWGMKRVGFGARGREQGGPRHRMWSVTNGCKHDCPAQRCSATRQSIAGSQATHPLPPSTHWCRPGTRPAPAWR